MSYLNIKKYIASKIQIPLIDNIVIENYIEIPKDKNNGDYALPCFKLCKIIHKDFNYIFKIIENTFCNDSLINKCILINGYINFFVNKNENYKNILKQILKEQENFGKKNIGNGKVVCIDYSSINIAKPFHIGHLRTTLIGNALANIYQFLGYKVISINHLGDYGVQFGKLIVAYKKWSSKELVEKYQLDELLRIYVKFHEEAEKDEKLNIEARECFKEIENKNEEYNEICEFFKEITLKEIKILYDKLNVHFDYYTGESFYTDKIHNVIEKLKNKNLLVKSNNAYIVKLDKYNLSDSLILKSDETSLYSTRDLAAVIYRKETFNFDKCLYVVASQQNLYFKQLFKIVELMGYDWYKNLEHISYGMVSLESGSMSTRKGNVVLVKDLIQKMHKKTLEVFKEKRHNVMPNNNTIEKISFGSIIFFILSNNKIKDVIFSYDKILNLNGDTCIYILYTITRCNSIIKKFNTDIYHFNIDNICYNYSECEIDLIDELYNFYDIIECSLNKAEPSLIAKYCLSVASKFNKFYLKCNIINEKQDIQLIRLNILISTKIVLTNALNLLGIKTVEEL